MEETHKGNGILIDLAEIADSIQKKVNFKTSIVFEMSEGEYNSTLNLLTGGVVAQDEFKIDISGTDFIFLRIQDE